eukprot:31364-Pelagococcus_subviridis.AAC.15
MPSHAVAPAPPRRGGGGGGGDDDDDDDAPSRSVAAVALVADEGEANDRRSRTKADGGADPRKPPDDAPRT